MLKDHKKIYRALQNLKRTAFSLVPGFKDATIVTNSITIPVNLLKIYITVLNYTILHCIFDTKSTTYSLISIIIRSLMLTTTVSPIFGGEPVPTRKS